MTVVLPALRCCNSRAVTVISLRDRYVGDSLRGRFALYVAWVGRPGAHGLEQRLHCCLFVWLCPMFRRIRRNGEIVIERGFE